MARPCPDCGSIETVVLRFRGRNHPDYDRLFHASTYACDNCGNSFEVNIFAALCGHGHALVVPCPDCDRVPPPELAEIGRAHFSAAYRRLEDLVHAHRGIVRLPTPDRAKEDARRRAGSAGRDASSGAAAIGPTE